MGPRLQHHLKDAALTALVAAGLGIFIVGFRTYDIGKGLTFDYQFVDLGIAIVTIFFGRLGLSLAADGLAWPALALGAVLGAIGASPLKLPSTFLHWFVTLAGLLIVLPLWRFSRQGIQLSFRGRYLGYFAALGLGFIMLEIVFIQRFTLYLGQPVYTLAVIIAGLLLFTGLGSYLTGKLDIQATTLKRRVIPLLIGVLIITSWLTPVLFRATLHLGLGWRIFLTLILLAPMGILLGMPFPTGIKAVSKESAAFIPWAWGINGIFSVLAPVLSVALSVTAGISTLLLSAIAVYFVVGIVFPLETSSHHRPPDSATETAEPALVQVPAVTA